MWIDHSCMLKLSQLSNYHWIVFTTKPRWKLSLHWGLVSCPYTLAVSPPALVRRECHTLSPPPPWVLEATHTDREPYRIRIQSIPIVRSADYPNTYSPLLEKHIRSGGIFSVVGARNRITLYNERTLSLANFMFLASISTSYFLVAAAARAELEVGYLLQTENCESGHF